MKNTISIICLALLCLTACTPPSPATWQPREMCMANLQEQFANPNKEYRSAPLWVWNTTMTESDIDRMLQDFKDQGFGGAFVHPRPGLETEYLGEEWFKMWRYSVEKGKELGLDIWIYDENSYPSGFAGGLVPDAMPESYNQGQALNGQRTNTLPENTDDIFMCLIREGDNFENITDKLDEYKGKEADYYIYRKGYLGVSAWNGDHSYVDVTAPGVTEKFIEITMQGYEKEFGPELGPVVKGIFTDEPQLEPPGDVRWTPLLFDTFQELWGYDLRTSWPLLGEKIGKWQKLRHDYNATQLHLFIERWSKPWNKYTEEHGMKWTGHYWEHGWPGLSAGPDNMAMYAWHQQPAIDMLCNQYDDKNPQAQFGNVRSVKELRSVANQMGYCRTLSETYGAGGNDERFIDYKRLGDWEYVLGVNFMNQHLSHCTITGVRKYDYPPEFTRMSPWWDDYKYLNDYFGRLSLVLSQGEQLNDWLILEPTTSLWLYGASRIYDEHQGEIGKAFQSFITGLEKQQMEFDLGCEDIIKRHGSAGSFGLRVGCRDYKYVVLPPGTENLESSTFDMLKTFVAKGGKLYALQIPSFVDGEENEELKNFIAKDAVLKLDSADELLKLFAETTDVKFSQIKGTQLFHHQRTYDDGKLIFVTNCSLNETAEANLDLPCQYLYKMDAITGEILSCSEVAKYDKASICIKLSPAESCIYFAAESPVLTASAEAKSELNLTQELQPTDGLDIQPTHQNALNLDFCQVTVDGQSHGKQYVYHANHALWSHFGGPDPWECAVQFRHTIIDRDTFTTGNIHVEYELMAEGNIDKNNLHIIVERPDIWEVSMNGTKLQGTQDKLLDSRCGDFPITDVLKQGKNSIVLSRNTMSIHAELAPIMVIGDFGLKNADKGFVLCPAPEQLHLGAWKDQLYPEYPWGVAYRHTYKIEDEKDYYLQLGNWSGTDAHVRVNGQKVGNISLPPYRLKLTPWLQKGENEVEVRIIGSMMNLYGPHNCDSRGCMGPGNWSGYTEQLPGKDYFLLPIGLEDDFKILHK